MSTYYGVNKTKQNNPIGSNILGQGVNKGNVCFMYDTYEASALADGSVIDMCDVLPVGAVISDVTLITDDLGSTVTLALGDGADDDRYITATSVTGANDVLHINAIAGIGYQVTGTSDTQLKLTGGGILTGTISLGVNYSV